MKRKTPVKKWGEKKFDERKAATGNWIRFNLSLLYVLSLLFLFPFAETTISNDSASVAFRSPTIVVVTASTAQRCNKDTNVCRRRLEKELDGVNWNRLPSKRKVVKVRWILGLHRSTLLTANGQ